MLKEWDVNDSKRNTVLNNEQHDIKLYKLQDILDQMLRLGKGHCRCILMRIFPQGQVRRVVAQTLCTAHDREQKLKNKSEARILSSQKGWHLQENKGLTGTEKPLAHQKLMLSHLPSKSAWKGKAASAVGEPWLLSKLPWVLTESNIAPCPK